MSVEDIDIKALHETVFRNSKIISTTSMKLSIKKDLNILQSNSFVYERKALYWIREQISHQHFDVIASFLCMHVHVVDVFT